MRVNPTIVQTNFGIYKQGQPLIELEPRRLDKKNKSHM